ncbi:transposase [Mycobacterium shottsii]|uniref:IS481 family transposase n=4 Tax=Mycobacterium ulcerans group TaxID=2993898 RepID=A0A7I7LCE8_9MYCO|nr:IS481 family transposase [Mycobacterium shottsii]QYL27629.1 transposase [Mycobacterium shottsii]QYL27870.1 transposase [Mycobacterium shottsii]QYL30283.1 transposase [Mycobacterium shottsii]BBX57423.1 IS481 family transposase [Mycobacterium shottsii]BBX57716.1 IS481 family transposase [Mycobacterium shottsii]
MSHANARTNVFARQLIVERVAAGWPAAHVAEQLGISRATVYKWLRRYAEGGDAALADRSSRPIRMPNRTSHRVEQKVLAARQRRKRGAVVLAAELELNPSTVGRILARHQVPHLSAIDPITGEVVRSSRRSPNRYEYPTPGAGVHVDVKKLGAIPPGGGWRLHGRDAAVSVAHRHKKTKIGYDYVHTAIDDYTRLAYSEVLPDEKDPTCAGFLHRALAWFAAHSVRVRRLLTDNALVYRHGTDWGWVCSAWQLKRRFSKPGCPWTNGKAERFNRTLINEWAYARPWTNNTLRSRGLDQFLRRYNTRRGHSALGGRPPISRLAV